MLPRDRRNCRIRRTSAQCWREADIALCGAHQAGLPCLPHQCELIAGINQVGIIDLCVQGPEFRPLPGISQKQRGNIPEGVAPFHGVLQRSISMNLQRFFGVGRGNKACRRPQ